MYQLANKVNLPSWHVQRWNTATFAVVVVTVSSNTVVLAATPTSEVTSDESVVASNRDKANGYIGTSLESFLPRSLTKSPDTVQLVSVL